VSVAAGASHEDSWLLLPWLASGRLTGAERARVELHVRGCPECTREVELQRLLCDALTEPERVTHAPGPSFRKLMARIDAAPAARAAATSESAGRTARVRAAWRPPGLAWAASFVLLTVSGVLAVSAYRWTQPVYVTHTDAVAAAPGVLHVAFERSLAIGDAEQLLLSAGARVVEGPDRSGVFGVAPVTSATTQAEAAARLQALAARLRTDERVRWIEPLGGPGSPPRER
jgi:putative zinc finger protein